ncbi:hypothetical protein ABZ543_12830 [Streptomyces roseifaciens]
MTETRTYGRRRALPSSEPQPAAEISGPVITGRVVATAQHTAMGGWDAMDKVAAASSSDLFLRVTEDPTVIKVLSDGPFDVYNNHWIDEIQDGSKSVRCWGTQDCPLCGIGDKPKKFSACFSVISLENPEDPVLRVWEAGIKVARQLKEIATDGKRGPLNRSDLYFSIRKTTKAKAVEYTLERIKDRDLDEEYGIVPLAPDILDGFFAERHTEPVKPVLDERDMREIVSLLLDEVA